MRFLQFLNEEQARKYSIAGACPVINKECQPFLNDSNGHELMRGISRDPRDETVLFTPQPTNRNPRDSSVPFNTLFNLTIYAAFGIEKIRQHSVFCTGNHAETHEYGDAHYIFPKGEYKILYSIKVIDSVNYEDEWTNDLSHYIIDGIKELKLINYLSLHVSKFIYSSSDELNSWDLDWLTNPSDEQAKWFFERFKSLVDKSILSKFDNIKHKELIKAFYEGLKKIGKDFYINDNDIVKAIKSDGEILMYESSGYFAVPRKAIADYSEEGSNNVYTHLLDKIKNEI